MAASRRIYAHSFGPDANVRVISHRVPSLRGLTIEPGQRAVLCRRGEVLGVLSPGRHRRPTRNHIAHVVDIRPTVEILPTQEIPTADGVTVKITVAVLKRIVDPERFVFGAANADTVLYLATQVALREAVATRSIDDLLTDRRALGEAVLESLLGGTAPAGTSVGLAIDELSIKDLVLPMELRRANGAVLLARAEGLAALERARAESASLRSLANAAKLVAAEPALLELRMLQEIGRSAGHTLVLGSVPGNLRSGGAPGS